MYLSRTSKICDISLFSIPVYVCTISDAIFLINCYGLTMIVASTGVLLSSSVYDLSLPVCDLLELLLKSWINLTNRILSRSQSVGMTRVKFLSCLLLAKARGMQKDNFCLFQSSVPLIYVTHCALSNLRQKQCSQWDWTYGTFCNFDAEWVTGQKLGLRYML